MLSKRSFSPLSSVRSSRVPTRSGVAVASADVGPLDHERLALAGRRHDRRAGVGRVQTVQPQRLSLGPSDHELGEVACCLEDGGLDLVACQQQRTLAATRAPAQRAVGEQEDPVAEAARRARYQPGAVIRLEEGGLFGQRRVAVARQLVAQDLGHQPAQRGVNLGVDSTADTCVGGQQLRHRASLRRGVTHHAAGSLPAGPAQLHHHLVLVHARHPGIHRPTPPRLHEPGGAVVEHTHRVLGDLEHELRRQPGSNVVVRAASAAAAADRAGREARRPPGTPRPRTAMARGGRRPGRGERP